MRVHDNASNDHWRCTRCLFVGQAACQVGRAPVRHGSYPRWRGTSVAASKRSPASLYHGGAEVMSNVNNTNLSSAGSVTSWRAASHTTLCGSSTWFWLHVTENNRDQLTAFELCHECSLGWTHTSDLWYKTVMIFDQFLNTAIRTTRRRRVES